jgi:cupin fold WbuC family metalloprotein
VHIPPKLTPKEIRLLTEKAHEAPRLRFAEILHQPGDELNKVVNSICHSSYMRPHLHPGPEKVEEITVLQGTLCLVFFGDRGEIVQSTTLSETGDCFIRIPAFTWHTYVIGSQICITYETMMGRYDPKTWKEMAPWAPEENTEESNKYLAFLKKAAGFGVLEQSDY